MYKITVGSDVCIPRLRQALFRNAMFYSRPKEYHRRRAHIYFENILSTCQKAQWTVNSNLKREFNLHKMNQNETFNHAGND